MIRSGCRSRFARVPEVTAERFPDESHPWEGTTATQSFLEIAHRYALHLSSACACNSSGKCTSARTRFLNSRAARIVPRDHHQQHATLRHCQPWRERPVSAAPGATLGAATGGRSRHGWLTCCDSEADTGGEERRPSSACATASARCDRRLPRNCAEGLATTARRLLNSLAAGGGQPHGSAGRPPPLTP